MIHSIKDFSDRQIEELNQCPGVKIDTDNSVAEVPLMAEGLFSAIASNKEVTKELKQICKTYKIYSRILEDYLWIAATEEELQELVGEGITEVIYTQEETDKLMKDKVSKEGLKAIHKVKNAFPGSNIEDISKKS